MSVSILHPVRTVSAAPVVDYAGRHRRDASMSWRSNFLAVVGIPIAIGVLMFDRRGKRHSHRR